MRSSKTLLLINFTDYYINEDDKIKPLTYLPYVNKINILIGTNNSGKSKFIREIMKLQKFKILDENKFENLNRIIFNNYRRNLKEVKKDNEIESIIERTLSAGYFSQFELVECQNIISEIKKS